MFIYFMIMMQISKDYFSKIEGRLCYRFGKLWVILPNVHNSFLDLNKSKGSRKSINNTEENL